MDAPPFCPSCGFNLRADGMVARGPWVITPEEVRFHGVRTALVGLECVIFHTLALACPRAVSAEVLANRCTAIGSIGALRVRISKMRAKLGEHDPIETIDAVGYRWCGA